MRLKVTILIQFKLVSQLEKAIKLKIAKLTLIKKQKPPG